MADEGQMCYVCNHETCWEELCSLHDSDNWVYIEQSEFSRRMEETAQALEGKAIEWGFDPAVALQWLSDNEASWNELMSAQEEERLANAKADIQEATDYVNNVLNNMIVDLNAAVDANQA